MGACTSRPSAALILLWMVVVMSLSLICPLYTQYTRILVLGLDVQSVCCALLRFSKMVEGFQLLEGDIGEAVEGFLCGVFLWRLSNSHWWVTPKFWVYITAWLSNKLASLAVLLVMVE